MANSLDLQGIASEIEQNLPSREYTLGKGLLQPFNETNSGSRKIMQGIQKEQSIQLCESEVPIIMTGYENQFGTLSSSFITADANYTVIDKIHKNAKKYCILLHDIDNNILHSMMRTEYEYHTELYGFNINSEFLDNSKQGDLIAEGTPLVKSASFDRYNNKKDGVNLTTIYMALGRTTEDPIVLSETAAKKFTAPIFNEIEIIINENDIPLNLYGSDEYYKAFPNIGEYISNNILCAIRRERKDDEALYSQSKDRLKTLMVSDTPYISEGEVIDIDIHCNNPEKLDDMYYQQLKEYYDKNIDYCVKLYTAVDRFMKSHPKVTMSYDLQKEYMKCKDTANNIPYIKDKVFNNVVMRIVTRCNKALSVGDKITDRYGGKGVVSAVLPDNQMPHYLRNGEYHPVDAIYNSSTIINRLNPGQSFETELTYIGAKILEHLGRLFYSAKAEDNKNGMGYTVNVDSLLPMMEETVYTYIHIINPEEADDWKDIMSKSSIEERRFYMESMINQGSINLVIVPMKNIMTIDRLKEVYDAFPWIKQEYLYVPQVGSNGQTRMVLTRRPMIVGKKYIYKLKQLAKEHFSAVSLASTNIRGENTKTKASKMHISSIPKTPVRIGNMEASELMQLPECQFTVQAFMMLSTSPTARRLMEQLLIGDPFDRNIVLDENARSRSVEIANAYLKCLGLRLIFEKEEKHTPHGLLIDAVHMGEAPNKKVKTAAIRQLPFYITYDGYKNALNELTKRYYKYNKTKTSGDDAKIFDKLFDLIQEVSTDQELMELVKKTTDFRKLIRPMFIEAMHMSNKGE
jgi:DNA-directed RNA polymerase, beta subunit/140 kD subunit|nr:MAG TPA: bifunctional DNA-directed RNA polymerase subunit beta/beta' [Caudoviricetes sp.]